MECQKRGQRNHYHLRQLHSLSAQRRAEDEVKSPDAKRPLDFYIAINIHSYIVEHEVKSSSAVRLIKWIKRTSNGFNSDNRTFIIILIILSTQHYQIILCGHKMGSTRLRWLDFHHHIDHISWTQLCAKLSDPAIILFSLGKGAQKKPEKKSRRVVKCQTSILGS